MVDINDCCYRQASELANLEMRHKKELEHFIIRRKTVALYRKSCSACSVLQDKYSVCDVHNAALTLLHPDSPSPESNSPKSIARSKEVIEFVSGVLRQNSGGTVRRSRHNSMEQLMQNMKGSNEKDSGLQELHNKVLSTTEEKKLIAELGAHRLKLFLPLAKSFNQSNQQSNELLKNKVANELISSHNSVLKEVNSMERSVTNDS